MNLLKYEKFYIVSTDTLEELRFYNFVASCKRVRNVQNVALTRCNVHTAESILFPLTRKRYQLHKFVFQHSKIEFHFYHLLL